VMPMRRCARRNQRGAVPKNIKCEEGWLLSVCTVTGPKPYGAGREAEQTNKVRGTRAERVWSTHRHGNVFPDLTFVSGGHSFSRSAFYEEKLARNHGRDGTTLPVQPLIPNCLDREFVTLEQLLMSGLQVVTSNVGLPPWSTYVQMIRHCD
jgi:hypothetical protein